MQAGYAVVFFSREGTLQPFINHLPKLREGADIVPYLPQPSSSGAAPHAGALCSPEVQEQAQRALAQKRLLTVHFTTVFEYICYLEAIAALCQVRAQR